MQDRICAFSGCGKTFSPKHSTQKFCCPECKERHWEQLVTAKCTLCGTPFQKQRKASSKFCAKCLDARKSEGARITNSKNPQRDDDGYVDVIGPLSDLIVEPQMEQSFQDPSNALNDPFGDYYQVPLVNKWRGEETHNA